MEIIHIFINLIEPYTRKNRLTACLPFFPYWNSFVRNDLYGSDHYLAFLSCAASQQNNSHSFQKYFYDGADWLSFTQLANITTNMIVDGNDKAVYNITSSIINAINITIPKRHCLLDEIQNLTRLQHVR